MAWVRIDDGFADHPKVISAGPHALVLQIRALCYVARHLTDGVLAKSVATMLSSDLAAGTVAAMVVHRLWDEEGDNYHVHDYLEYNPSKSHAMKLRGIRSKVGRHGGLARAKQFAKPVASDLLEHPASKTLPRTRTRTPKNPPTSPLTVDTLAVDLGAVEAYRGLDVRGAILRCEQYWLARGVRLTKRHVVNWLNKDAADHVTSNGHTPKPTGPHYLDLRSDEQKRQDADHAATAQPRPRS
jgi:hypothetical protein